MFQVTFSEQSLSILNSLTQGEQLVLMEKLSSLSSDILDGNNQEIGKFNRKGKADCGCSKQTFEGSAA